LFGYCLGTVYNALDACSYFGVDANALDAAWGKAKKADKLVKLGGGFYCGLIDTIPGKTPIYVFNGFFMSMRSKFVTKGTSIHYYVVDFDSAVLPWSDFRGKVLGATSCILCIYVYTYFLLDYSKLSDSLVVFL